MTSFILAAIKAMPADDYVGFTFFVGCMAMMAASAFFFLSINMVEGKWKTSLLVSGLITFIAAVHYYYMRDYWAEVGESPTFFRYVDWTLTVPKQSTPLELAQQCGAYFQVLPTSTLYT